MLEIRKWHDDGSSSEPDALRCQAAPGGAPAPGAACGRAVSKPRPWPLESGSPDRDPIFPGSECRPSCEAEADRSVRGSLYDTMEGLRRASSGWAMMEDFRTCRCSSPAAGRQYPDADWPQTARRFRKCYTALGPIYNSFWQGTKYGASLRVVACAVDSKLFTEMLGQPTSIRMRRPHHGAAPGPNVQRKTFTISVNELVQGATWRI